MAIWKQKIDRWYIVAVGESKNKRENLKNVIDELTPRQFREAVEKDYTPL